MELQCAGGEMLRYDAEKRNFVHTDKKGFMQNLGFGRLVFSIKRSRTIPYVCELKAKLVPVSSKDYEIVPFNPDEEANATAITRFMDKYITKPFTLGDNTVGVEVNFNKEFYVPETIEPVNDILKEIAEIDKELNELINGLGL